MRYLAFAGSATTGEHPEGLRILQCDAATGDFRVLKVVGNLNNPIYMALSADGKRLYTVMNDPAFGPRGRDGGIAAWRVEGERLEFLNKIPTGWTTPCHISLSPDGKTVVYAEYSCGTAGYAELAEDGSLKPEFAGAPGEVKPFQVRHEGEGPNKPRQDRAHAHCAAVTPDGKYMLVVDLTLDKVAAYDLRNRAGGLKEVKSAGIDTRAALPGAGPRHIAFHPNGKLAFVIFELHNLVGSYRYTGEGFEPVEVKKLLPPEAKGFSKAAAVKVSEDGKQVFCSNRGWDSITVFNVDGETGKLEWVNNAKLDGKYPRDFEFMPGGKHCLVGLKESWEIASYAYDAAKGTFEKTAKIGGVHRPLFFKFAKAGGR